MNRVPEIVYRVLNRGGRCQGEDRCCGAGRRGPGDGLFHKGRIPALIVSAMQGACASVTSGPTGKGRVLVGTGRPGTSRVAVASGGSFITHNRAGPGGARGPCSRREGASPAPRGCGNSPLTKKSILRGYHPACLGQQHSWAMQQLGWKPRYLPSHTVCDNDLRRSLGGKKAHLFFLNIPVPGDVLGSVPVAGGTESFGNALIQNHY